ncbi:Murein DD-endopeptidase MepM and murein hydrolase activator NlpD, contain LysM domain [Desulfuromusa kysingii]|uniref:Murein DD-endopeptidase MepM and murein hydrolase activator NlpD, contain LysM domain n=1 Tax=Desulfuromusa kysingii TaxID=37625 RepID=A0A1H3VHB4_9BACT|nr:M23 family metallopeptidase [Desulfuromusa kysingii]SDZ73512.1 Murein DD-endopeptidase MepM and murein hydrolase activator NlpD, contain LysM domain [Desulfuromusa kysingii]
MKLHFFKVLMVFLFIATPINSSAGLQLEGSFTQSGLLYGHVEPGTQIFYGERQLKVSLDGDFILGFGRDATQQQTLTLVTPDGITQQHQIELKERQYNIQRINGISARMMAPNAEDLRRIQQEANLVAQARQQDSDLPHFKDNFSWPIIGRISGIYGSQRVFNGEPRRPHFGIDIAAPTGTPVKAPAGGIVTLAHQGMFFSGATLIIDHGHGLSSSFLHLAKILVQKGEKVSQGQTIATVGATGRVTGPHLDWRINWFDQRLDPALLVPPMPQKSISAAN